VAIRRDESRTNRTAEPPPADSPSATLRCERNAFALALTVGAVVSLVVMTGCSTQGRADRAPGSAAWVFGQRRGAEAKPVAVRLLGGFVGIGHVFTREDATASTQQRSENLLQERLGLGASGYLYTPRFVKYETTGVVGISQNWADDASTDSFDTGELYEVDAHATAFPQRFHPLSLQFSRLDDYRPRVFFSQIETATTTARALQQLVFEDVDLRFESLYRKQEQTVFGSETAPFADVTETRNGAAATYRLSTFQTVNASYNYRDVRQREAENSYDAHEFLGSHAWYLDEDRDHDLRSRLEATEQSGSLDQSLLRWDQRLSSRWTDSLSGDADFRYEQNDTNLLEQESTRGSAGLRHQLYDSLSSSLRVEGGRLQSGGESTTDSGGVALNLGYRKITPWGRLQASYSNFTERRIVENGDGGAIDERHAFPPVAPEEVRLLRAGIDLTSIVITDPTGLTFYTEGIDYTLRQDGAGLTTVTRSFAGLIPIGGTILVDYVHALRADFTMDSMHQSLRLEHEFTGGLAPYFRLARQDQRLAELEGFGVIQPVEEQSLIGGVEWRRPAFTLGAEYENRESTVLPLDAVRLRAQGTMTFGPAHQLIGSATQSWLFYEQPDRDLVTFQTTARWRSRIDTRSRLYFDTAFRHDDDSLQGSSLGFSVGGGLEYAWRLFTFRFRVGYRETHGVTSEFRGAEVGFFLIRRFGAPPPTTDAASQRFLRQ